MATAGRRKRLNRFDNYEPLASLSKIDLVGLVNNQVEYDLGTPSLDRREDITLVGSSSRLASSSSILVEFKWRPCREQPGIVCLWAHLVLHLGKQQPDCYYEYEQIITYRPTKSTVRPGYILQYGSNQSALKLHISAPYRRTRLTFNGPMKMVKGDESPDVERMKINLVISPTSGLFDFKEEVLNHQDKGSMGGAHDRHEQLVQIKGEYQRGAGTEREKLLTWGFYSREFKEEEEARASKSKEKRLLAHLSNGLAFHLGNLGQEHVFGYYTIRGDTGLYPLKDFSKIYLPDNLDEQEFSFELKLGDRKTSSICELKQREQLRNFYDIEFDRKWSGWALVSPGADKLVEQRLNLNMEQSVSRYLEALAAGRLAQTAQGLSSQSYRNLKPLVVSLTDSRCTCADLVGSKAASLAHLRRLQNALGPASHYMVPHAFVLTRYANEAILESNQTLTQAVEKLEKVLANNSNSLNKIKDECEDLVKLAREALVPERLKADLLYFLDAQFQNGHDFRFAIRSSSWAEDDEDMSGAGQLSTYLGVQGLEEILKAAVRCFASKFSFANVEYKRQHGLGPNVPMAVVVQEMVECEKAGVLFTCDPQSSDTSLITITANYGLGESVVSGESDPDSIRVRLVGDELNEASQMVPQIEQVSVGQKLKVITSESERQNGFLSSSTSTSSSTSVFTQPTQDVDRSNCCLNEAEILKLSRCGLSVAKFFEGPRDLEWGFLGQQLYLFQARPITNLDTPTEYQLLHENDQPARAEVEFCTRANVGEVIPSAIKPLTFTCAFRSWALFVPRIERTFKFSKPRKFNPECSESLLHHSCHIFLFLVGRRQLLYNKTLKKSPVQKAAEVGVFGHELDYPDLNKVFEDENQTQQQLKRLGKLLFVIFTRKIRQNPLKQVLKERTKIIKARDELRQMNHLRSDNRLTFLYEQMKNCLDYGYSSLSNHAFGIIIANEFNGDLMRILSKYIDDPVCIYAALAKILSLPRVISAEIPQRIDRMARLIRNRGQVEVDRFLKMSPGEALNYLRANDSSSASTNDLTKEFREFIDKFGHRCYNEFDIEYYSWREKPEDVVDMIRKNCVSPGVVRPREQQETDDWRRDNDAIIESLNLKNLSFMDRLRLKHFQVPRCQLFVSIRELTKDILILYTDLMRESTRLLAQELRRQLRLPDENLMYFMLLDELEPLIREPQPALVIQAKRRRQMFNSLFKELWLFDEVIADPDFTPNHLKAQNKLDRRLLDADKLHGTPASSGRVQGKVCLVRQYSELDKVSPNDVLVAHSTDIAFSPVFPLLSGIVTEVGGIISHGAVVAREYGLPSVLGVPNVTKILQDGEEIILDADNGCIIRLGTNLQQ